MIDVSTTQAERYEASQIIGKVLPLLSEREQDIIIRRVVYGETYKSIGREYGITGNRVGEIFRHGMRMAKARVYRLGLRFPDAERLVAPSISVSPPKPYERPPGEEIWQRYLKLSAERWAAVKAAAGLT